MLHNSKEIDKILYKCIDDAFKESLGESTAKALLHHIGGEVLMRRVEAFSEALERIFSSGAYILEIRILECLYSEVGKTFQEVQGYRFADYVNDIKRHA